MKIRGHRVDAAEIERLFARLPAIREVAVVARTDRWGRSTLFAYLVCQHWMQSNSTKLRSVLQTEVPDYMVPTSFVFMDALPRTPNGKIDRQSLPESDGSRPELDVAFVASRTPTERALEGIWHQLLKRIADRSRRQLLKIGRTFRHSRESCIANSRHLPRRYADRVDVHRTDQCSAVAIHHSIAGGPRRTGEVGDTSTKDGRPMPPLICVTENLVSRSIRTGQPRVQLSSRVPLAW